MPDSGARTVEKSNDGNIAIKEVVRNLPIESSASDMPMYVAQSTVAIQANLPRYNLQQAVKNQVDFERQFSGMEIDLPQRLPFAVEGVINVRAEPQTYFRTGVANPDVLSVKPLNEAERRELFGLRDSVRAQLLVANDPKTNLLDRKAAWDDIKSKKEKFFHLFPRARMEADAGFNGTVNRVCSDARNWNKNEVIFVNGINTDFARSTMQAWDLSRAFGAPIRQVVNVNDPVAAGDIGGALAKKNWNNLEGAQEVNVKQLLANPRAATATANVVYEKMMNGGNDPITLVAYSQGGAIVARALEYVVAQLGRDVQSGKMTDEQRKAQLDRVHVVGIASAAAHRDFPKEIRDRVNVVYDRNDAIPKGRNYTGSTNYFDLAQALGGRDSANTDKFSLTHNSYFFSQRFLKPADHNPAVMAQVGTWVSQINSGNSPKEKLVELDISDRSFRKVDTPYLP